MTEVTLAQMLDAREQRVFTQKKLLEAYGTALVCFTMNIAGPVKDSPLIRRAFRWGCSALEHRLGKVLYRQVEETVTGPTAFYAPDLPAGKVKEICVAVEESCPMGRLFDMDVLPPEGTKLDREDYGGGSRDCIVCGAKGRGCASRRIHGAAELQAAANRLMTDHFRFLDAEHIASLAVSALLEEVCITPKPGLVDRANSGSHKDMDIFTFTRSAAALSSYFTKCVKLGMEKKDGKETFLALRRAGLDAEIRMLEATGGVNTHKGAIFTMGLLCGAAGMLWMPDAPFCPEETAQQAGLLCRDAMEEDFKNLRGQTAGERLYEKAQIRGVRGEAAQGLPSVVHTGLPAFRQAMERFSQRNTAGVYALIALIAAVEDTNMLHRGSEETVRAARKKCRYLLEYFSLDGVSSLDRWFIENNLSPGGSADLLAATLFLYDLGNLQR